MSVVPVSEVPTQHGGFDRLRAAVRWPFHETKRTIAVAYAIVALEILAICGFNGTTAIGVLSSVRLSDLVVTVPGTALFPWIGGVLILMLAFRLQAGTRPFLANRSANRFLWLAAGLAIDLLPVSYGLFAPVTFLAPLVVIVIIDLAEAVTFRSDSGSSIIKFYGGIWASEPGPHSYGRVRGALYWVSLAAAVVGIATTMLSPRPWVAAESLALCRVPQGLERYVHDEEAMSRIGTCRQGMPTRSARVASVDGWVFEKSDDSFVLLTYRRYRRKIVRVPADAVISRQACEARPSGYLRSVYNLIVSPHLYSKCEP